MILKKIKKEKESNIKIRVLGQWAEFISQIQDRVFWQQELMAKWQSRSVEMLPLHPHNQCWRFLVFGFAKLIPQNGETDHRSETFNSNIDCGG